jgi:hypothetical protein
MELHREEVVGIFLWYEEESLFVVRRLKKYSRRVSAILASDPCTLRRDSIHCPKQLPLLRASTHGSTRRKFTSKVLVLVSLDRLNLLLSSYSNYYNSIFLDLTEQFPFPWQFFSYLPHQATRRTVHIISRAVEKAARHGYYFRLDGAGSI